MKPLDPAARASRPEHDVHLTENVMVPMRDGLRMATDIYRPARDGRPMADRRPVLLQVNQDWRGWFGSERGATGWGARYHSESA